VANLLRKLAGLDRDNRIAGMLESEPAAVVRWRDLISDAGKYLFARTRWSGRPSELLDHAADVHRSIERRAVWEETHEWRIGTASTNRIERTGSGYRASTECDGLYAANVTALPTALEAIQVLFSLQMDLFYDVGWASWVGRLQMTPSDPPRAVDELETREPYLTRLSREALTGTVAREAGTTIRRARVDWSERTAYEVVVENGPLSMTCASPTIERANQFAGIFRAVQRDILRLLTWN
jgi:hypothetical protein